MLHHPYVFRVIYRWRDFLLCRLDVFWVVNHHGLKRLNFQHLNTHIFHLFWLRRYEFNTIKNFLILQREFLIKYLYKIVYSKQVQLN